MRIAAITLPAAALLALAAPALAVDDARIAACAKIVRGVERLDCYDALARELQEKPMARPPQAEAAPAKQADPAPAPQGEAASARDEAVSPPAAEEVPERRYEPVPRSRAERLPLPQAQPPSPAKDQKASPSKPAAGKWRLRTARSSDDEVTGIYLHLKAEAEITGWPGKTVKPTLVLRCKDRRTSAYVVTGMMPQVEEGDTDAASVTLRLDGEAPFEVKMGKSVNGEALFFPSAVTDIKRMSRHRELLFAFTPFNSEATETTFRIEGLDEAVTPLRQACGW